MLSLLLIFFLSLTFAECRSLLDVKHVHGHYQNYRRQNEDANGLILLASAVQSGSAADGSNNGVSAPGQSKSAISQNNFINFCEGKTLTNGLQVTGGSCNGIPMGEIPSRQNMVSSIITFPVAASTSIEENTTFQISVQMINFVAGSFTNAQATYYAAPQELSGGKIVGHTHVTVQNMGANLNPSQPLNPEVFVFFKGINDAGDGNGLLSATVTGGLPAGNYRVCTMASASNHQLVLMPVAQRGAQDDCTKFTIVSAGNGGNNGGAGQGAQGPNAASSSSLEVAEISSTIAETSTTAVREASTTSAAETTSIATLSESSTGALASQTTFVNASTAQTTSILSTLPVLSSSPPPFANTSFVAANPTTTRGKKTRTKNNTKTTSAGNAVLPAASASASTTTPVQVAATTSARVKATTTRKVNNNGAQATKRPNSVGNVKASKPRTQVIKIIHRITIIRTFFVFRPSLGGLPPAVNKKGNNFAVGNQEFPNLPSACQAACGEQFLRCVTFGGPGFEREKCEVQRKQCGAAADIVTNSPAQTPVDVTATVTVPAPTGDASSSSLSLPGTVLAEETVSSVVELPPSPTPAGAPVGDSKDEVVEPAETGLPPASPVEQDEKDNGAVGSGSPAVSSQVSPSVPANCAPVVTVTVERPVQTVTVSASATSSTTSSQVAIPTIVAPPFSNSTIPRRRRAY